MATLAVSTDPGGVVLGILKTADILPRLCAVCTAPEIAKLIPTFNVRRLPEGERRMVIAHAKTCKPCREQLGWGEL